MTQLKIETIETVTVIKLIGDIDAKTTPAIQDKVLSVARSNSQVILDLSQVGYMSSAGLRMLLLLYRTAHFSNENLIMVGLTEEIRDTMSITGFLNFFTTSDTIDSALASFQNTPNKGR